MNAGYNGTATLILVVSIFNFRINTDFPTVYRTLKHDE